MKSFFERLKCAVSSKPEAKGHVLGTATDTDRSSSPLNSVALDNIYGDISYDIKFTTEVLGFGVYPDPQGLPIVEVINNQDLFHIHNMRVKDIIVAVDGCEVLSFESFMERIVDSERPITLSFVRKKKSAGPDVVFGSPLFVTSGFSRGGHESAVKSVSDADRQDRREAFVKAAMERNLAWEKKIATARKNKAEKKRSEKRLSASDLVNAVESTEDDVDEVPISEETARSVLRVKDYEKQVAQSLGYDPFKPMMSSSAANAAASASTNPDSTPPPPPQPTESNSAGELDTEIENINSNDDPEVIEEIVDEEVDRALALVVSVAEEDPTRAQTALQTMLKMLTDLSNNKSEPKYRTIRLENASFQNKVASIPGALDFMFAAGFGMVYETPPSDQLGTEVCYLRHVMDPVSELQLSYCIRRLRVILE